MFYRVDPRSACLRLLLCVLGLILTTACLLPSGSLKPATPPAPTATLTSTLLLLSTGPITIGPPPSDTPTPPPTVTLPYPTAESVLGDLCFDFLRTLVGKTLILDSEADLIALYDQADQSKLCGDLVARGTFDFTSQQIVGAVYMDQACDVMLSHESTELDDSLHQRVITLRATLIGDCDYDLIYPVWLAIERPPTTYTTQIQFVK